MSWVENSQDYLIVLYEDVQKNPREELVRILEYLDQPVDSARLDCLMKQENLEGPFHRAHHLPEKTSSNIPLPLDSIPPASTSQQDTKINYVEQPDQLKPFSHYPQHPNDHHHHHQDDQTLLLLNSKKSQQQPHVHQQQQHLQSLPPLSSSQTTTQVGRGNGEEQKEENKILSSSPSSPPPPPFQTISSTNSQQNQYTSKMTSSNNGSSGGRGRNTSATASITSTFLITDDNHHNHNNSKNNRLNKGSTILRLDLIIQDNIDKINRFFQHKSIPVQLHYSLRPSTIPYFLQNTTYYCNTTVAATIYPTTITTNFFSV